MSTSITYHRITVDVHCLSYTFEILLLSPSAQHLSFRIYACIDSSKATEGLELIHAITQWPSPPCHHDIQRYYVTRLSNKTHKSKDRQFTTDRQRYDYISTVLAGHSLEESLETMQASRNCTNVDDVETCIGKLSQQQQYQCCSILTNYFQALEKSWKRFTVYLRQRILPTWRKNIMINAAVILGTFNPVLFICPPPLVIKRWKPGKTSTSTLPRIFIPHDLFSIFPHALIDIIPIKVVVSKKGAWYNMYVDKISTYIPNTQGAVNSYQAKCIQQNLQEKLRSLLPPTQWLEAHSFANTISHHNWWSLLPSPRVVYRIFLNGRCIGMFLPEKWQDMSQLLSFLNEQTHQFVYWWESSYRRLWIYTRVSQIIRYVTLSLSQPGSQSKINSSPLLASSSTPTARCWPATFMVRVSASSGVSAGQIYLSQACVDRGWGAVTKVIDHCILPIANMSTILLELKNSNLEKLRPSFAVWKHYECFIVQYINPDFSTVVKKASSFASLCELNPCKQYTEYDRYTVIQCAYVQSSASIRILLEAKIEVGDYLSPSSFAQDRVFKIATIRDLEQDGNIHHNHEGFSIDGIWCINPNSLTLSEWKRLQIENDCMHLERCQLSFPHPEHPHNCGKYWYSRLQNSFPLSTTYLFPSNITEIHNNAFTISPLLSTTWHRCHSALVQKPFYRHSRPSFPFLLPTKYFWPLISPTMIKHFQACGAWESIQTKFEVAEQQDVKTPFTITENQIIRTIVEENPPSYYPAIKYPNTTVTISLFENLAPTLIVHLQLNSVHHFSDVPSVVWDMRQHTTTPHSFFNINSQLSSSYIDPLVFHAIRNQIYSQPPIDRSHTPITTEITTCIPLTHFNPHSSIPSTTDNTFFKKIPLIGPPAAPLGAKPLGTKPLGAEPLGAEPLGAEPLGAEPLGAEPLGAEPLGAEPLVSPAASIAATQNNLEQKIINM